MNRWSRHATLAITLAGFIALSIGPVRYLTERHHTDDPSSVSLLKDPYAPKLGRWPVGIVDDQPGHETIGSTSRRAPRGRFLTVAQARATAPTKGYVSVTGPPSGHYLPGVGSVVTASDVNALVSMDEPERTTAIRYVTAPDGAALGLVAMDQAPSSTAKLVDSRSSDRRRLLLARGNPNVREMIDVWAQQRPDISVLVDPTADPYGPGAAPTDPVLDVGLANSRGTAATDPTASNTDASAGDIMAALLARDPVVAPALFDDSDSDGLFARADGVLTPTALGRQYVVTALAVPPGSRIAPTTATGHLTALAFERPRGGASVMVWNPGLAKRITVDLPYGDTIHRVRFKVAGDALTAVLLRQ